MKQNVSLSIDSDVWRKAKKEVNNISKQVNNFLKEISEIQEPERIEDIKNTINNLEDDLKDLEESEEEMKGKIESIREKKKTKEVHLNSLRNKLDNIEKQLQEQVLVNGDSFKSEYIQDKTKGGSGMIKAFYVPDKQKCKVCGKELEQNSIVRMYQIDNYFICSNCYEDIPKDYYGTDMKKKRANYSSKGILKVEL